MMERIRTWGNGAVERALGSFRRVRPPRAGWHAPLIKKTIVTAVILAALYWGVTSVVAYITAPRLEMTMSPVVGRIAVVAEPAKVEPIQRKVTYTGSVSPFQEVTVYPRWEGWVEEFKLYEGDRVEQGRAIARLDRGEIGAALQKATATAAATERERPVMEAEIEALKASLVAHHAALRETQANLVFWERDMQRVKVLFDRGAIAAVAYDEGKKQYESAVARVAEHEARIKLVEAKLVEAQARLAAVGERIKAAQAEAEQVKTRFSYTTIEAPISGRVAKRHIYAGILVKPGMPIVDLQDLSRVRVQAKVAESDLLFVRVGTEAIVRMPALPEGQRERRVRVTTVFPQLDPVSRTATVEILLDNPGELIKPDMYAIVDLVLERKEKTLVIPRQAILDGPDGKPMVYVTDAVTATARPVKLGIAESERVEVVEGLKEGEMVVAKGQRSLSEGAEVNVVPRL
ncbi:MAG: efflux RND transporter periplasmic adaptor subunit [Candidatus Rokubacteria bacterium]|nr:efflux RND transporter periplasmic adaptor subunit [Candidatus Rokubacteria bacterium]